MRRYFRLPSQSLDYISNQLGLGGKIKMEMQDWIDIVTKNANGEKSLKKMTKYCRKDVEDTRTLWNRLSKHFEPKFNMNAFNETRNACKQCGSDNVVSNGTRISGGTKYQTYLCNSCYRYAGRHAVTQKGGKLL